MNILVCIDDTDNLESRGTGELASLLASQLEELGWGESRFVTRHQLLVHPDIPYTSHNSSMCFAATLREASLLPCFIDHAGRFLERESAPGSDPGLCVAASPQLGDPAPLVAFGRAAKEQVLDKAAAYALAGELGIHLSEHGGSGQGVVGAVCRGRPAPGRQRRSAQGPSLPRPGGSAAQRRGTQKRAAGRGGLERRRPPAGGRRAGGAGGKGQDRSAGGEIGAAPREDRRSGRPLADLFAAEAQALLSLGLSAGRRDVRFQTR